MPAPIRYDIAYVLEQIARLHLTNPEIWDEGEQRLLADMLEGETDLHRVAQTIVDRQHEDEDHIVSLDHRIDLNDARSKRFKRRVAALRALILKLMQHAEIPRLQLDTATLSVRRGPPRVIVTDETRLPEDCFRVTRKPNLTHIKELIDQGVSVPGATLSNAEPSLTMGTK